MDVLVKPLMPSEIKCKVVCIPAAKRDSFAPRNVPFDLSEGDHIYSVRLDKQYRIRLTEWFNRHPSIKAGDKVTFSRGNGVTRICIDNDVSNRNVSLKELLGKDTAEGRVVDIQHTPEGAIAIVQKTSEIPLDEILAKL